AARIEEAGAGPAQGRDRPRADLAQLDPDRAAEPPQEDPLRLQDERARPPGAGAREQAHPDPDRRAGEAAPRGRGAGPSAPPLRGLRKESGPAPVARQRTA